MYCRGKREDGEDEWATAEFKKNKIRELNEYRIEQIKPTLTKIKKFFSNVLNTCRNQIKEKIQDKTNVYSTLGFLYQHGYGFRKITSRATELYKLAAEQGNVDAAYNLGYIYHQHYHWKWNYRESFKWYTIAANGGNICAQNGLALLYLKGLGTDVSYPKALHWYTKAAKSRNINATISLASIYRKGDIVEQDYTKVLEWYRKAIKEGSTVAQNSLESLYNNKSISVIDSGSKIDFKFGLCSKLHADISNIPESTDLENLKKLASYCKRGDGHAMFDIGKRYSQGNGFPKDKYIAFKWIKNAAKAGISETRRTVAKIYKDGDGIDQGYHKSSIWYMRAAKAGDDKAQYELGLRQDTDEAINLYNEAFKQKNPQAVYKLGQMYERGGRLETNAELAMKLFGIAAHLGSLDAQMLRCSD
jgi:TPR repeat protein